MNWKQFFIPQISKIIILFILILVFGVPATSSSCQGFVRTPTPSPCIEKFTFSNIISDVIGLDRYPYVLDASTHFSYNPIIVTSYVVAIYLVLSLIFLLSGYKWKRASLYVIGIILIIFSVFIFYSMSGARTYVE